MKIGVFDSGLGGLLILEAIRAALPHYSYVYFGDTANLPYGNKREAEIYTLTVAGVTKLFEQGAELVIVACNTASAESLRRLQDEFLPTHYPARKVLGVIIPTIETLADSGTRSALLVGTERTIDSKKYQRELSKVNNDIKLISEATPTLVPLIEAGDLASAFNDLTNVIDTYVREVDTIILGCTHYVVLKNELRAKYPNLQFVAQDEIIPNKIKAYLVKHADIEARIDQSGTVDVLLSNDAPQYQSLIERFSHASQYSVRE